MVNTQITLQLNRWNSPNLGLKKLHIPQFRNSQQTTKLWGYEKAAGAKKSQTSCQNMERKKIHQNIGGFESLRGQNFTFAEGVQYCSVTQLSQMEDFTFKVFIKHTMFKPW